MSLRSPVRSVALTSMLCGAVVAILLGGGGVAAADPVARDVFGAASQPSTGPTAAHGAYARGCLAGGVALAETGPDWQAMRLSRNRNWGHSDLVAFIPRLAAAARAVGWPGLYIGDLSQPRGGPMRSGHRSHQIGLDVDIWLRRPAGQTLSRSARESISSTAMVTQDRMAVTAGWTASHHAVIRAAASDPAVARIFVNAAIKRALCTAEPADADRGWLRVVRAWWGHDSHFHVRLACPAGASGCIDQDPPPPGDGCGAELDWWFTEEALNPKPGPAKPPLRLSDLPPACAGVVTE